MEAAYTETLEEMFKLTSQTREELECIEFDGEKTNILQAFWEHWTKPTNHNSRIGVIHPNKVSTIIQAMKLSEQLELELGLEVGYTIPFEEKVSDQTLVHCMTDEMFIHAVLEDPDLKSYSVLVIYLSQEMTLNTTIVLALIKYISKAKESLRFVFCSPETNVGKIGEYFNTALNGPMTKGPRIRSSVNIYNTKIPQADYIEACVIAVIQLEGQKSTGNILVHLTSFQEIKIVQEQLEEHQTQLKIVPIFDDLPLHSIYKIFEESTHRKVFLATNVVESLTLPSVENVIDCGFQRHFIFDSKTGLEYGMLTPITKFQANLRALQVSQFYSPEKNCYRMYPKTAYDTELVDEMTPAIQRSNLARSILVLKCLGINDFANFDLIDKPSKETFEKGLEHLYALGALNHSGQVTITGRKMAEFPLNPMMSKMIVTSEKYQCSIEIVIIVGMLLNMDGIFHRPKNEIIQADWARRRLFDHYGDHMTLLNIYKTWTSSGFSEHWCKNNFINQSSMLKVRNVKGKLEEIMAKCGINLRSTNSSVAIRKAITSGFFFHAVMRNRNGSYRPIKSNANMYIHPNSTLYEATPKWMIYHESIFASRNHMNQCIEIDENWLLETTPHYFNNSETKGVKSSIQTM